MKKEFKTVTFRNYKNPFNICELGYRKQKKNEGVGDFIGFATLRDEKSKNVIMLTRYDMSKTDLDSMDILTEISGAIPNQNYDYLIDTLNNNTGLVVEWSQVDGTTSDYRILHDIDISDNDKYKDVIKKVSNVYKQDNNEISSYKYTEYKNGIIAKV